jgi:hypothetical protein
MKKARDQNGSNDKKEEKESSPLKKRFGIKKAIGRNESSHQK